MRLRVTLLRVDEVGKLGGVTNEKHGSVVEDPVEVALLGLDLDSETCTKRTADSATQVG